MVFADQQFDIGPAGGRTHDFPVFFGKLGNCLVQARQHLVLITIVSLRPRIDYGGQDEVGEAMKLPPVGWIPWISRARSSNAMLTPDLRDRYRVIGDEIVGKGSDDLSSILAERARDFRTNVSSIEFNIFIPQLSERTFDRLLIASP